MTPRPLRIALLGTRGVPSSYSGFETCVEELGRRLVERGHEVTVYCRSHHVEDVGPEYRGMRLVRLPTVRNKYLDTIVHSFLSSVHALARRYDVALYFIAGNSLVTWIPRLVGTRTVINVDGLDWKRKKWPAFAKAYIRFAERMATVLPDAFVTDSEVVRAYYRQRYGVDPPVIAYGSELEREPPGETLAGLGLEPGRYVLFVGRLVEENCAHHLVEAFRGIDTDLRCVVVGDAPYADAYKARLRALAADDPRIVMPGYVFGRGYRELGTSARIFVLTSEVGGTHPALVEAMAMRSCCVVNGTAENRETIGDAGLAYDGAEGAAALRRVLEPLLADEARCDALAGAAERRARERYGWEPVTDRYLEVLAPAGSMPG